MAEADGVILSENVAGDALTRKRSSLARLLLMLSVPLLLAIAGFIYWQSQQGQVTTDNAYVHVDKVSISAQIGGKIIAVAVKENQHVKAGDLLFQIDPEPFELQLMQADAAIATAQADQIAAASSSSLSGADVAAARESIAFAKINLDRQAVLWQRGFTTKASYDAAQHQLALAEQSLALAQSKAREAAAKLTSGSQIPGVYPQLAAARAQRKLAELNVRRTTIHAPVSGMVSQADRLHIGQEVLAGLPVVTLVADGTTYVEANFKETDLADMRVGQPAEVRFDAFPGITLKAHVGSIGVGTGSEFSVLPAQNATGNWVKVTQRVPVRIILDEKSPRPLIAGLSTKVKVYTDGRER